ncbi:hypothetical protein KOW79_010423 [Hemibagrus wyckioides]|uniref:Uncharacterized protein n=1 Tax=Hemibagrus wyckioides TaxID=337641 RepID=A0A9D3SK48_9TELE|nr:hypothetical protein KOW79_010423 [Hemibagrus wyckioides]
MEGFSTRSLGVSEGAVKAWRSGDDSPRATVKCSNRGTSDFLSVKSSEAAAVQKKLFITRSAVKKLFLASDLHHVHSAW